jgi:hypothetical protein
VKSLHAEVKRATDNNLDLAVLLPLTVGAIAVRKLKSPESTPLWLTLAIFSFQTFLTLHTQQTKNPDRV